MALDLRTSEIEHEFIQDRIAFVEYFMSQLCTQFSSYNRKIAHLRDSGDQLAKTVLMLASKEILNPTLRPALGRFSDILRAIQDYREAQVQRIDHRVVLEFTAYNEICTQAKQQVKKSFATRIKELNKKARLEKVRAKTPTNWQQINEAEREADKARSDASMATYHLSQEIESFEKKKLDDLKRIFLDFITIELQFHAKALDLYTKAYEVVYDIKPDDDLKEFRNHFKFRSSNAGEGCLAHKVKEMAGDASHSYKYTQSKTHLASNSPCGSGEFDPLENFHFPRLSPILEQQSSSSSNVSDESIRSDSTTTSSKKASGIFRKLMRSKKD